MTLHQSDHSYTNAFWWCFYTQKKKKTQATCRCLHLSVCRNSKQKRKKKNARAQKTKTKQKPKSVCYSANVTDISFRKNASLPDAICTTLIVRFPFETPTMRKRRSRKLFRKNLKIVLYEISLLQIALFSWVFFMCFWNVTF